MSGFDKSTAVSLLLESVDSEEEDNKTIYNLLAEDDSDDDGKNDGNDRDEDWEKYQEEVSIFRAYLTKKQPQKDLLALPAPEAPLAIELETNKDVNSEEKPEESKQESKTKLEITEVERLNLIIEELRREITNKNTSGDVHQKQQDILIDPVIKDPVMKKPVKLGTAQTESKKMRNEFRKECKKWEEVEPNVCNEKWKKAVTSKYHVKTIQGAVRKAYNMHGKILLS